MLRVRTDVGRFQWGEGRWIFIKKFHHSTPQPVGRSSRLSFQSNDEKIASHFCAPRARARVAHTPFYCSFDVTLRPVNVSVYVAHGPTAININNADCRRSNSTAQHSTAPSAKITLAFMGARLTCRRPYVRIMIVDHSKLTRITSVSLAPPNAFRIAAK